YGFTAHTQFLRLFRVLIDSGWRQRYSHIRRVVRRGQQTSRKAALCRGALPEVVGATPPEAFFISIARGLLSIAEPTFIIQNLRPPICDYRSQRRDCSSNLPHAAIARSVSV